MDSLLVDKKITVRTRVGNIESEDVHRCKSVRRVLPANETRPEPFLQFYAERGGMRTVGQSSIVKIR